MSREYLGALSREDPVCAILTGQVLPKLGVQSTSPRFRVYRLGGSNAVFEYEHRDSGRRIIGKFYGSSGQEPSTKAIIRMWREFRALGRMERIGLQGYPHHVARALAAAPDHGGAIFLEHLDGETLGTALDGVSKGQVPGPVLYERLTALAYFLATMHNRTVRDELVEFEDDVKYLKKLADGLREHRHITEGRVREFEHLTERWESFAPMWQDRQVCLHGDATPANFLFTQGLWVGGIDFERSHYGDRVFDVGRIAGEIQHHFMLHQGSRSAAEPYIGHFLWEYACHFPDRALAFEHICKRVPFQVATTLLRIARNPWITADYRVQLVVSARDALASR